MSKPLPGEEPEKIYPLEKRLKQHYTIIELYKQLGYEVIEVPQFDENITRNISKRLNFILDNINLK